MMKLLSDVLPETEARHSVNSTARDRTADSENVKNVVFYPNPG
jgi:hypothetical protein